MKHSLFDNRDSLVKKASYLRIEANEFAQSIKSGNFRSQNRGQGIEFSGVRDYIRGDDIRSIDWNVTARMGKPFVKVFEEERELQMFLIVDRSLSMQYGIDKKTKYEVAAETAALIAIAAELNNCPIGAVFFDGKNHFCLNPSSGKETTMILLTHLDELNDDGEIGSVLANALTGSGRILKKRSLVFILSDFRSADWQKPLIQLAQKNDVIAINYEDKSDIALPSVGSSLFSDCESDLQMILPSNSQKFKKEWKMYNENKIKNWREICVKHGIYPVVMSANDDPLQVLTSIFKRKKKI